MKDIRKALGPVRRKLRCVHLWKGVGYGVLSAGALFLGITICSFIIPIRDQAGLTGITCSSAVFISALVSLLIPVNDMSCARGGCTRPERTRSNCVDDHRELSHG